MSAKSVSIIAVLAFALAAACQSSMTTGLLGDRDRVQEMEIDVAAAQTEAAQSRAELEQTRASLAMTEAERDALQARVDELTAEINRLRGVRR